MQYYEYTVVTHPGNRPNGNEDNFYINGRYRKDLEQQSCECNGNVSDGYVLAAICDGMGGHAYGELASLYAVETMNEFFQKDKTRLSKERDLVEMIEMANERICRKIREEQTRIGSTLALIEIADERLQAANLGDSRIYRFRNQELRQMSDDHTTAAKLAEVGLITQEEAKNHPMRHQIWNHLGILPEEKELIPSVVIGLRVMEEDRYLLCSDGLSDLIEDEVICQVLLDNTDTKTAVNRLLELALEAGGDDNITIMLLRAVSVPVQGKGIGGFFRERFKRRGI